MTGLIRDEKINLGPFQMFVAYEKNLDFDSSTCCLSRQKVTYRLL